MNAVARETPQTVRKDALLRALAEDPKALAAVAREVRKLLDTGYTVTDEKDVDGVPHGEDL